MPPSPRPRVTRDQWVDAATTAFRRDGLAGVRVEALARTLGVTKGSFYWHFDDRRALVDAVVERWEAEQTEEVIARTADDGDAHARLRALFAEVAARGPRRGGERRLYLEAAAEGVQDAVRRVTARRVEHVTGLLTELGIPADVAHRRAVISLAAAVGADQLADTLPAGDDRHALVATALEMALSPA
ncbi:TetR/AcrR family transcriptional regulator [Cellulomonas wangsupingiae]|uniref:TetR/AcrR family transcriptional regulator n=1 Tax=Cellulomonas wangsupingiae TaxID=2968085 RepID=UPI001D0F115E|nr:TetR/AcrR family transcriptional regulator [Cellulomonas wangsupingiae]MCM0641208.1 TetR/AcrR family transcriptional regulator [Cellulomonas wangsupingiae]